jgi:glutathione S-transferase
MNAIRNPPDFRAVIFEADFKSVNRAAGSPSLIARRRRWRHRPLPNRSHDMTITITAFESSPDRGEGQARDMRVRWALEEVGRPYEVRLLSFEAMKRPEHMRLHPFGQIPTYEEGDLVLFESGAIILHIAERNTGLLPAEAKARSRTVAWMFAALNSVEPPIVEAEAFMILERDKPWYEERLPILNDRVRTRLGQLSGRLGDSEWLDGDFSAADLLMVTVLRRLEGWGILEDYPNLAAYVARGEGRPAFKRAFDAQLAVFEARGDRHE